MKIDSIVRELRCVEKKYQDKILSTYKLDIYAMAKASADTIECLQKALDEKTELLNATIAGQETLQKAFAESQRRELAAVEDLCGACGALTRATGHGWEDSCYKCQWWRGAKEKGKTE